METQLCGNGTGWVEGEPQLVTVAGEKFRWEQLVEDGRVITKKIQM